VLSTTVISLRRRPLRPTTNRRSPPRRRRRFNFVLQHYIATTTTTTLPTAPLRPRVRPRPQVRPRPRVRPRRPPPRPRCLQRRRQSQDNYDDADHDDLHHDHDRSQEHGDRLADPRQRRCGHPTTLRFSNVVVSTSSSHREFDQDDDGLGRAPPTATDVPSKRSLSHRERARRCALRLRRRDRTVERSHRVG